MTPSHLIAHPGDDRSACGIKDPLPVVWVDAAQRHVDGRGLVVCEACQVETGEVRWPVEASPTTCNRCAVDISAAGYCIDSEFLCPPCYRNERPVQQSLDLEATS